MGLSEYLKIWIDKERTDYEGYNNYIRRYKRANQIANEIPPQSKFIQDIMSILSDEVHLIEEQDIAQIFSTRPSSPWTQGKKGPERLKDSDQEFVDLINQKYSIKGETAEKLLRYLERVSQNCIKLIETTYSITSHYDNRYEIVNGNKYLKLMKLMEDIKNDNRSELKKYHKTSEKQLKVDDNYRNPYNFWIFGNIIFEIYSLLNLQKEEVYIFTSRVNLDEFNLRVKSTINNFSDLFGVYDAYSKFASEDYEGCWLCHSEKHRNELEGMPDKEVENVLRHIEIDQLFSTYNDKYLKKRSRTIKDPDVRGGNGEKKEDPGADNFNTPLNLIFYGPVGTGKTRIATELARSIVGENFQKNARFVTFHKSYSYENFVEGIWAEPDDGRMKYIVKDQTFKTLAKDAMENPDQVYVMVIDEINRGDVSRIFGELITLIEDNRRIGNEEETLVQLQYSGKKFGVPKNLYIIGTMNTTDHSISLMDHALRRRFSFRLVPPDPGVIEKQPDMDKELKLKLVTLFKKMNKFLSANFGDDMAIGHAYFLNIKDYNELFKTWVEHIVPLLDDLYYGNNGGKRELLRSVFPGKKVQDDDDLLSFITSGEEIRAALEEETNVESENTL